MMLLGFLFYGIKRVLECSIHFPLYFICWEIVASDCLKYNILPLLKEEDIIQFALNE